MPKAFLLTNKRYKIWKQIKDTFREEQKRLQLLEEERRRQFNNHSMALDLSCYSDKSRLQHIDTTDYSKYTNSTDDEDDVKHPHIPSPAASPTSSTRSSSTSSDESDGGYSFTTEIRPESPSIEFGIECRTKQHISFLYELMTGTNSNTTFKDPVHVSVPSPHDNENYYKAQSEFPALSCIAPTVFSSMQPTINRPIPQLASSLSSVASGDEGGENHVCLDCGKQYSTSSNLARHRQTHRASTDKKARKCPHCEKMYVSMPAYSMHVRTHNQGCECKYCGKRFSRPWLLQGHIRTHTGEKPFSCTTCHKSFADKSNLRAHIQTHSSEKPFICGRCGKAFALKSYLYKHEESSCMRGQRFKQVMSLKTMVDQ